MQQFVSRIHWQCPQCGESNSQDEVVPELNFMAEKMSDMTVDDQTEIACGHCAAIFSGRVWVYSDYTEFEIEEPHEFTITGDMPMYEPPEEDYEPADDPPSVAREALGHLGALIGTDSPVNDDQFTNRLVFAGAVSTMEAYLGDTLINAVVQEPDVRDELVKNNSELGDLKATAAELASDPKALDKRIVSGLREVLYHNLRVVIVLYRDAFGIDLMPTKEQRDLLFPAMQRRHDCVHRNGRNKEGEKLTDFTDEYVRDVISAILAVLDHVEDERAKDLPF